MILELEPHAVAHGGYAVARIQNGEDAGMVVFISGAIPGERVRAEVTARAKRHIMARTIDVLSPSPDRVPHFWPEVEFGVGGADLGHVSTPAAIDWKRRVIADLMERIGGAAVAEEIGEIDVVSLGEPTGWRTRANFVANDDGKLCMRREGSRDLVPIESFPLAVPALDALNLFDEDTWAFKPGSHVRAVMPSASPPVVVQDRQVFTAPGVRGQRSVLETVQLVGEGEPIRYKVDATGFWQAHKDAPATLANAVIGGTEWDGKKVLELFSGAGLFTLPLAMKTGPSGAVVGIEGSNRAVKAAARNLRKHPHARTVRAAVGARAIREASEQLGGVDAVVMDPPRAGAGAPVVQAIAESGAREVVMVSCDPATAARDLKALATDFAIEDVTAYDLFPGTHHVEMVARLKRREGASK